MPDKTYSRYYVFVYITSSIAGIWPYLKPRTKLFRISLLLLTTLTVIIAQAGFQYMCKLRLQCTAQNFATCTVPILVIIMMYTIQSNARTIKTLTEHLFIDWEELKSTEEYDIMKSYAKNSRRLFLFFFAHCFLTMCIIMLMSLMSFILDIVLPLNESRPVLLPYPSYYFVDAEEYVFQIFSHTIVAWFFLGIGIMAHDGMFITYIEHICSSFAVIGYRFEHLFSNEAKGIVKLVQMMNAARELRALLAQLVEDVFNIPNILQLFLITVGLSLTLLQIAQHEDNILEIVRYMSFISVQMTRLFIFSFEGQKLIDHSLQIRDRIYNSSWYNVSAKSRELVMMVMMKSLRPSFISAGKIYIFSLKSFITVVQASISYFAMLSSFH
ncbi:hypothetical protein X777_03404 [Ooceraea biroi]|uniref:Odorant receptor n=1 Tax=Ooceraea biroi TaxID=2015173 RepID=A0A026X4M5_OOCBI|nr:hypothetical protein X777_03404 [Ooceraea biroi]